MNKDADDRDGPHWRRDKAGLEKKLPAGPFSLRHGRDCALWDAHIAYCTWCASSKEKT